MTTTLFDPVSSDLEWLVTDYRVKISKRYTASFSELVAYLSPPTVLQG